MAPLPLLTSPWTSASSLLDVLAARSRSSLARLSSRSEGTHHSPHVSSAGSRPLNIAATVVVTILGVFVAFGLLYLGWRGINHFFGPFARGVRFEEAVRDKCSPIRRYRRWKRQRRAEQKLNAETGRPTSSIEMDTAEARERAEWLRRVTGEVPSPSFQEQRRTSQIELHTAPETRRKPSVIATEGVAPDVIREKEFC